MRIAALILAFGAIIASDSLVDAHFTHIQQVVEDGNCPAVCLAYENPTSLHLFHWGEKYLLGALLLVVISSLHSKTSINWLNTAVWLTSLVLLVILGLASSGFEMIADGASTQYGLQQDFMESSMPMILLDATSCLISLGLLYFGPPRGWDGSEDLGWF